MCICRSVIRLGHTHYLLKSRLNLRLLDVGLTLNTDRFAELGLNSCYRPCIIPVNVSILTPTLHLLSSSIALVGQNGS